MSGLPLHAGSLAATASLERASTTHDAAIRTKSSTGAAEVLPGRISRSVTHLLYRHAARQSEAGSCTYRVNYPLTW